MEAEPTTTKQQTQTEAGADRAGAADVSRAYLFMLWGACAFAVMGALSHLAGERCGWQIIAAARTSLAFVFSLAVARASGVRLVLFRPRLLWMRSLVGSVGVLCAFYSLTHQSISTALTLSNSFPVWVALLAWPVLGQRPAAPVWVAVAAGLVGVVLIQRPDANGSHLASFAALGNAVCTAVAMIGLNRLRGVDARAVVVHFSGVSTVVCLAFLFFSGAGIAYSPLADARLLATLVGVGLAGTVGQLGMTRAFALGDPSKVAVVGLMQIVFACALDLVVWQRHFDAQVICGIILVTAPTAWLLVHSPLRRSAPIHVTTG